MSPSAPKLESLFEAAIALGSAGERASYLDRECPDPQMRREVESLLASHDQPDTLFTAKTIRVELPSSEGIGSVIGRYKLLEALGEGGFGSVWLAEQREPVRRKIALKIIKLGMDTKQIVARFEAERQALALMDHPNIAKVIDAGTTDTGRSYFVMELVRGIPITRFCDENKLATHERLELFIKVCHAIQHAHQKGIIHRDIKPSNVLVTLHDGVPVPKVIDFGIAKATQQDLTDKTIHTQFHQFIGTPAYVSPEQAEMSGLDIDTRSDIYSLGVLLYELLAGSTPFDAKELMASGLDVMRKTIREKEPMRPSTRLATLGADQLTNTANRRSADTSKLLHQLKGDLDWIVMKCLEKDRQRRYDTANGLAADLKRHLDNEPVLARPPSAAYRFQKAFRRNKLVFAAGTAVATALIVGLTFSVWQAVRATRAEKQAIEEKAQALTEKTNVQAALKFIQDDVLSQASPGFQPDRDLTVRTLLDRVTDRLDQESGRPPLVEASIRQTLGSVYTELGDYAKAVQHYERARQLLHEHRGEDHPDTLRSLLGLAVARRWIGDIDQAQALTLRGLEASRRALGEKNPLTLQFMQERAFNMIYSGAVPWADIEPLFRQALELHREVLDPNDLATLRLIYSFGLGLSFNFQPKEGALLVEDGLKRSRSGLRPDHPLIPGLMTLLAHNYSYLNKLKEAEALLLPSLELRRKILGTSNSLTINSLAILARTYVQQGNFVEAEKLTEELKSLCQRVKIEDGLFTQWNVSVLGWCYLEQGHFAEAGTVCELAVQAAERKPDGNPLANANTFINLGAVRLAQEQYADAEKYLRKGLPFVEKYWAREAYRPYVMSLLGASLSGQKRYDDAEPLLRQGYEGLVQRQASLPPFLNAPRRITEALERLVQLYDAWGKPAPAAEWKQKLTAFQQANQVSDSKSKTP